MSRPTKEVRPGFSAQEGWSVGDWLKFPTVGRWARLKRWFLRKVLRSKKGMWRVKSVTRDTITVESLLLAALLFAAPLGCGLGSERETGHALYVRQVEAMEGAQLALERQARALEGTFEIADRQSRGCKRTPDWFFQGARMEGGWDCPDPEPAAVVPQWPPGNELREFQVQGMHWFDDNCPPGCTCRAEGGVIVGQRCGSAPFYIEWCKPDDRDERCSPGQAVRP